MYNCPKCEGNKQKSFWLNLSFFDCYDCKKQYAWIEVFKKKIFIKKKRIIIETSENI